MQQARSDLWRHAGSGAFCLVIVDLTAQRALEACLAAGHAAPSPTNTEGRASRRACCALRSSQGLPCTSGSRCWRTAWAALHGTVSPPHLCTGSASACPCCMTRMRATYGEHNTHTQTARAALATQQGPARLCTRKRWLRAPGGALVASRPHMRSWRARPSRLVSHTKRGSPAHGTAARQSTACRQAPTAATAAPVGSASRCAKRSARVIRTLVKVQMWSLQHLCVSHVACRAGMAGDGSLAPVGLLTDAARCFLVFDAQQRR